MPDTIPPDGPFYIDQVECVTCGACQAVAPDLIEVVEDVSGCGPYRFRRQPQNAVEEGQAIAAINGCCVACIYYRGDDPEITRRISDFPMMPGHTHSIPQLSDDLNAKQHRRSLQRTTRRLMMAPGAILFACAILDAVFDPHMTALKGNLLCVTGYVGAMLFFYAKARS